MAIEHKALTVVPKAGEIIAGRIRRAIAGGTLPPGTQLPAQPELAQEYGVSAPTMREALRILETEGLVEVRRGVRGGAYVNSPNLGAVSRQLGMFLQVQGATMRDLYEARMVFEPPAARLLAGRWTKRIEKEMRANLDEQRSALDDPAAVARVGGRFEVLLLEHCGNVTLAALGIVIADIVERHAAATLAGAGDLAASVTTGGLEIEEKLVELMAKGDGAAAERHWRGALEQALKLVQKAGVANSRLDLVE